MEKIKRNQIIDEINNLKIKEELKKELLYFNNKIENTIKITDKLNINVIIDERSMKEINILLEHITEIIKKYEIYKEIINYTSDLMTSNITDSVIIINDFEVFEDDILDSWNSEKKLYKFLNEMNDNNNMIIFTYKGKLENKLNHINKNVFNPKLCIKLSGDKNIKDKYNELLKAYNEISIINKLSYQSFKQIVNTLGNDKYLKNENIVDYIYDYSLKKMILTDNKEINSKLFNELLVSPPKERTKINNQINDLIGLENIKNHLESLYNYLEFQKKIKNKDNIYLNMFFLGNPGTGKTTVARMYAEKLYSLGYIKENKLIEVVPNDLIGEYVGQTRETIREILKKAKNGLLFIDEAYLLTTTSYKNGKNPYMEEAIVELIKYLEDPSNIVIFAGYPNETRKIYEANPGIKSRIYGEIVFEDYSNEQLYQILENNLIKKGLKIDSRSKNKIIKYIDILKKNDNFGNARSILQLGQKMLINHANSKKDCLILDATDLPKDETTKLRMGFRNYD